MNLGDTCLLGIHVTISRAFFVLPCQISRLLCKFTNPRSKLSRVATRQHVFFTKIDDNHFVSGDSLIFTESILIY